MMQFYYQLREWFLIYFNTFECLWAFFMNFMIQLIILHPFSHSNDFKLLKILITIFSVAYVMCKVHNEMKNMWNSCWQLVQRMRWQSSVLSGAQQF